VNGGRKLGIGLLTSFLVLLGLLVVADRVAAWVAEDQIAEQIAKQAAAREIRMRGEPDVTVEGFPFLTQVVGGEFQAVNIRMSGVSLDGVDVDTLDIRATGVAADVGKLMDGSGEVRASRLTGSATVPFSVVEEALGIDGAKVTGDAGQLVIRVPFDYGPGSVTALARAGVSVADGVVKVKVSKVGVVDGELPSFAKPALDAFAGKLSREVAMPKLPYGLKLHGATITDAGVAATASAKDVPLGS
jgi:hypothetical protein